jgi:hypothetical protein
MASNNMGAVEKAYNAIYDFLINKCENADFYKACMKEGFTSLAKSSIYFDSNDLYDVMMSLQEIIKQNNAKENGNGDMRKSMLTVIKNSHKCSSNRMCEKGYTDEDGYTMVCDGYTFIKAKGNIDIPKWESGDRWFNYNEFIPNTDNMREVTMPTVNQLKLFIKLNKGNRDYHFGKTMFFKKEDAETGELLAAFDANYLLNLLEAFNGKEYKCYIKSKISPMVIKSSDGDCGLLCTMRID